MQGLHHDNQSFGKSTKNVPFFACERVAEKEHEILLLLKNLVEEAKNLPCTSELRKNLLESDVQGLASSSSGFLEAPVFASLLELSAGKEANEEERVFGLGSLPQDSKHFVYTARLLQLKRQFSLALAQNLNTIVNNA